VKFYVSTLVGVIIKVILQNARCNNKVILVYVSKLSKIGVERKSPNNLRMWLIWSVSFIVLSVRHVSCELCVPETDINCTCLPVCVLTLILFPCERTDFDLSFMDPVFLSLFLNIVTN